MAAKEPFVIVVRSKKKEWRSICNEANETKNTMGKEWLG
jgi:hypothetical protein